MNQYPTELLKRQYRVYYRRAGAEKWGTLEPGVHSALYDVPPVHKALNVLRANPEIEAVVVRHEDALLNIVTFEQEAVAPKSFILEPGVSQ